MFLKYTTHAVTTQEPASCVFCNTATDKLSVSYDAVNKMLLVNWEGEAGSDGVRKCYDIVMEQIGYYKPQKLLLDFHNRVTIRRIDQRWVFSSIFPRILRTIGDNVFVAIVLPVALYHGLVAEMNGDELMHENSFLIIHHALYREEAYRWLNDMCPCHTFTQ